MNGSQYGQVQFNIPRMTPGIKWLLIVNASIFVLQELILPSFTIGGDLSADVWFQRMFALYPFETGDFLPWQFFSFQFLHVGFRHLFFNMLFVWMLGIAIEQQWGTRRFLVYYLLCGVAGGFGQILLSSMTGDPAPLVGASAGVFGIIVAFGLMHPNAPMILFPFFFPIKAKILMWVFIGMEVFLGFSFASDDNVSHFGHLGGALMGFFLLRYGMKYGVFQFCDKMIFAVRDMIRGGGRPPGESASNVFDINEARREKKAAPSWFRSRPPEQEAEADDRDERRRKRISQEQIDAILDKMNEGGFESLSPREKEILKEYSRKL